MTAEALAYEFSRAQSRVRAMFGDEAAERILSEAMRRHAERGWEWQRVVDWLDGLNGSEAPR